MGSTEISILEEIAHFMSIGEFEKQQRHFQFPYPVFYGDALQVAANAVDAAAATRKYLQSLTANCVAKVSMEVVETICERPNRCCLRVVWSYADASGRVLSATQNDVYFGAQTDGTVRITQIDILVSSNKALRKNFRLKEELFNA